ncbi:MAG: ABC transporter substrate-binding protein, partial [Mesorhizobium sp.]
DVMIMNIESKQATEDAQYIEKLAAVGIPVVYVDFREHPFTNTEPSMRLIGKLFGQQKRAEEFIAYRAAQIARVTEVIAEKDPKRPTVFVERAGGYSDDCCMSFGNDNFG